MNIRNFFTAPRHTTFTDAALLLTRVVAGIAFMIHGWPKIQNPFAWMPDSPIPGVFLGLAALAEFGGGLAWILGLLTAVASLGLLFTMVVAVVMHAIVRGDPFVASGGGASYELAAVYFCIALLFLATGPGRFSLDRMLFGPRDVHVV